MLCAESVLNDVTNDVLFISCIVSIPAAVIVANKQLHDSTDAAVAPFTVSDHSLLINLLSLTFSGHSVSSKAMGFTRLAVMLSVTMIHLVSGNYVCVHAPVLFHSKHGPMQTLFTSNLQKKG